MAESALNHDDYTVAWICPIEVEQIPAILMLDTEHDPLPQSPNDHNAYTLGRINGHNVVLASLPTAGNCPAATVITQMRNTFRNLRFCLLVGIGGGVPTTTDQGPLRLGHVVVSKPSGTESGVIQCDHGKVEADGRFNRTGVLAPPPPVLLNSAQKMSVRRRMAREDPLIKHLQRIDTSPDMMPEYGYPGREKDPLYDREIQGTRKRRFEAMEDEGCPKWIVVHRGTIATSEKVVKNAEWRDRLSEAFGAICFEMEAAGALVDFPCLIIRGISDYADESKNDDWQPYAAASAAAYARELFFHMPVDQVKQCSIPEKDVKQMIQDTSRLYQSDEDRKIGTWLAPPNPSTNHNAATERRLEGTGQWLLEGTEFSVWKASTKSALWVHGIPGCGKTILSSIIIQHLQGATEGMSLAYFFFDFSDTSKQSFEKMVRSLIFQLSGLNAATKSHLSKLYRDCNDGRHQPDLKSLCITFEEMSNEFPYLTLLLDALDECERVSRESLMKWLGTLACRILMTSRKLEDIQYSIRDWGKPVAIFSFQESPVDKDIRAYVRQKLGRDAIGRGTKESKLARKWKDHDDVLYEVEKRLTEKAGGMFRWVACQLDALEEYEMAHDLLQALESLPDSLSETYQRILDGIPRKHFSNSTRILQFLAYAKRPFKIEEAVDILATTPDRIPEFDPRNRMPDPQGILKFCSSLVTISEDGNQIQLAHFSVKEYLTSSEVTSPFELHLQPLRAEESIINVLLAYLSSLKDPDLWREEKYDMLKRYPLAQYGAQYWIEHARTSVENVSAQKLILDFFAHEDAFFISIRLIFNPESHGRMKRARLISTPLYLASMNGWKHVVEGLLSQTSVSTIDTVDAGYHGSALRVACHHHHVDVVRLLLDKGANVNLVSTTVYSDDPGASIVCMYHSTALMTALCGGHDDLVELLLENYADPNAKASCPSNRAFPEPSASAPYLFIRTYPLIWASLWGFVDSTRMLLEKGALPNKTDQYGNSALLYACWSGHYKIANLLLAHEADINEENPLGTTPFYAACESGYDEVIRLLLERGRMKNVGILVSGGKFGNALQIASYWGRLDAVNLLLSYGVDPNQTEGDYGPALHAASSRGHLRVVELLLNRGADPHMLDSHQWTALFLAIKNGHDDASRALWQVSQNGPLSRCLFPSTFIQLDKNQEIENTVSERTLEGSSRQYKPYGALSNHPFAPTTRHIYFQITVLSTDDKSVGVGLCCRELLLEFSRSSYHFATRVWDPFPNNHIIRESSRWQWFLRSKPNDIIGCGVNYDSNISFFTLNGELFGTPTPAPIGRLFAALRIEYGTRVQYDFTARPPDFVGSLGRQGCKFEQAGREDHQRFGEDEQEGEQIGASGRGGTHGLQEQQDAVSQAKEDEAMSEDGARGGGVGARQAGEEAGEYDAALSTASLGGEDDGEEERVEEQGVDDGVLARHPA